MHKNKILMALLIGTSNYIHAGFDDTVGTVFTSKNEESLYYTSLPYAIARQGQRAKDSSKLVKGFLELENTVLSISEDMNILETVKEGRKAGNYLPLTPYSQTPFIAAEYLAGAERGSNMLGQEFERPQDANTVVQRETSYMLANYITGASDARGCFQAKPLRYGDVDADNINELVLFLGHQVVVFSPEQAQVVFSSYFWLTDEADEETKSNSYGELNNPEHPQFVASSGTDQLVDDLYPAWRSLTKLFNKDFNNDGKYDFVIWKKAYQSNLNSEAVGFHKIADVLMHYEKVDGVYQYNSDTSQSKMIGWLADNQLTWSKGYPSVSECEGEEGKLIPEMHDALLNDPEVLK